MTPEDRSSTRTSIILLALLFAVPATLLLAYFVYKNSEKRTEYKSRCGDTCQMYIELQELREKNEWLRTRLKQYELQWKSINSLRSDLCDHPSKFDFHYDVAFGRCTVAKKDDRERWNLITRDLDDQIIPWKCSTREGDLRSNLPKKQRAKLYKDANMCLLRWVRVMEDGSTGNHSVVWNGVSVELNWKRKAVRP